MAGQCVDLIQMGRPCLYPLYHVKHIILKFMVLNILNFPSFLFTHKQGAQMFCSRMNLTVLCDTIFA